MVNNNISIIIWKKSDKYYCYANNCGIKNGTKLNSYIKNKPVENSYKKILEDHNDQIIRDDTTNYVLILKYIPDDIIIQLNISITINVQLLSALSHKIRNPLTNILGVVSTIDKSKLSTTQKESVDILKKSSYEIISTVNDVIDIVNFARGESKLNLEKVTLIDLLNQCKDIVANDISNKNLIFKIVVEQSVPKKILADDTKLKQIIINMVTNSIQNIIIGGIVINVSLFKEKDADCPFKYVKPDDSKKYNILFSIKDSGSGMNIFKKNLVDSILGINNDPVDIYNYGGLGLIICKYICNLMGGNIWFKTSTFIGTTFYFNIIADNIT